MQRQTRQGHPSRRWRHQLRWEAVKREAVMGRASSVVVWTQIRSLRQW